MKVCERCGEEISTKDGENFCPTCERRKQTRERANRNRRERDATMRSTGLKKVKGAMGGTY